MAAVVAYVAAHPGCRTFDATLSLLTTDEVELSPTTKPFRRAMTAVARAIRDRLVRHEDDRLAPWDPELYAQASRVEAESHLAADRPAALRAAAESWRRAGDDNRARMLERLAAQE